MGDSHLPFRPSTATRCNQSERAVHAKSEPLILKGHMAFVSSLEAQFEAPDFLQYFAVFCSPRAFFKHLYISEQRPFNPSKFHARGMASSAGCSPGFTTDSGSK